MFYSDFIFTFQHLSGKVTWAWDCAKCDEYFQSHIGRRDAIGNYKAFVNVECMLKIYIKTKLHNKRHLHQTLQCMKIVWKVFYSLKTILLVVIVMNINFFFIVDWNKITRFREENIKDMYDRDTGIEITIVR